MRLFSLHNGENGLFPLRLRQAFPKRAFFARMREFFYSQKEILCLEKVVWAV